MTYEAALKIQKTEKLKKIEARAWNAFNVYGNRMGSKVMDSIAERWAQEVKKILGFESYLFPVACSDGTIFWYDFSDVCA